MLREGGNPKRENPTANVKFAVPQRGENPTIPSLQGGKNEGGGVNRYAPIVAVDNL
jgi:hypothetical protein